MSSSEAVTQGVRVRVDSQYIPEHSQPERERFFFAYRVRITNEGPVPVQLISRHWIIESSGGEVEEVQGPGVVGAQPRLDPGQTFEYTSFCPLPTPTGSMRGTYQMVLDSGEGFDAEVGRFELSEPLAYN
ncbi:MAG: Co2+/Mg2+ efflux protein ApaG [Myxococcota bacterium]|nr:Co2+/Mg2+ efflux protein ApaG [Myxococcota bacterium]